MSKLDQTTPSPFDWTFQVVKNYNLPGAKATFTANVGRTNEVVALVLVSSTSMSQVSHMLVDILEKGEIPICQFSIMIHAPTTRIFGVCSSEPISRCTLVYSIYCIKLLMDTKCELYWKGLVSLKNKVYRYNDQDLTGLYTSLRDGSFSHDRKKYSLAQINELRYSKCWKECCGPFLKKIIIHGPIIANGIERWIVEFLDKSYSLGRPLFTRNTKKIAKEQTKKVKWVQDPPQHGYVQRNTCTQKVNTSAPKMAFQPPRIGP
jgi:hypothetical protein